MNPVNELFISEGIMCPICQNKTLYTFKRLDTCSNCGFYVVHKKLGGIREVYRNMANEK